MDSRLQKSIAPGTDGKTVEGCSGPPNGAMLPSERQLGPLTGAKSRMAARERGPSSRDCACLRPSAWNRNVDLSCCAPQLWQTMPVTTPESSTMGREHSENGSSASGTGARPRACLAGTAGASGYSCRTRRKPASTGACRRGGSAPACRVRYSRSRARTWETLTTESRGSPGERAGSRTLPGASASARLLAITATMTV